MNRPVPAARNTGATRYGGDRGFSQGLFTVLLLTLLAAAGVAWVSLGIVAKERWPIRWLEVNGSFQRVSAEQIRVGLAPLADVNFFTVDLRGIERVARRNPWVAGAVVVKQWPDTVVVTVSEHVPVAHWNSGQLISSAGKAFAAPEADEIQGLPWLSGPDIRLDEVLDHWVRFDAMLETAGLEVTQLKVDERGSWSMVLGNGTRLQLGRDATFARLERLMNSWGTLQRERERAPVLVDLRYTNGFAVHWPQDHSDFAVNER